MIAASFYECLQGRVFPRAKRIGISSEEQYSQKIWRTLEPWKDSGEWPTDLRAVLASKQSIQMETLLEGKPDEVFMVMLVNFVGTPVQNITAQLFHQDRKVPTKALPA